MQLLLVDRSSGDPCGSCGDPCLNQRRCIALVGDCRQLPQQVLQLPTAVVALWVDKRGLERDPLKQAAKSFAGRSVGHGWVRGGEGLFLQS